VAHYPFFLSVWFPSRYICTLYIFNHPSDLHNKKQKLAGVIMSSFFVYLYGSVEKKNGHELFNVCKSKLKFISKKKIYGRSTNDQKPRRCLPGGCVIVSAMLRRCAMNSYCPTGTSTTRDALRFCGPFPSLTFSGGRF